MARKIKLEVLTTEKALQWANQTVQSAKAECAAVVSSEKVKVAYGAGIRHGYMQAIADLKMHGYLEAEK